MSNDGFFRAASPPEPGLPIALMLSEWRISRCPGGHCILSSRTGTPAVMELTMSKRLYGKAHRPPALEGLLLRPPERDSERAGQSPAVRFGWPELAQLPGASKRTWLLALESGAGRFASSRTALKISIWLGAMSPAAGRAPTAAGGGA
eukprot:CAMPEP_0176294602 /NCGR_PEP_ID=MMETSP0121_2-20121125/57224_1 /TAXON_ID=160619 /ORGANISM="Kryptoperidinium foliaceum, Strain CCMP 1326" /LENGTH=147 /DNA_ID=CAMNT_0017635631 /DNA_START=105 /DNA_END=545 /DNA_ORIENTATION=+